MSRNARSTALRHTEEPRRGLAMRDRVLTAELMRELRRQYGLTQQELADLVPVDVSIVTRWEIGERHIYKASAHRLFDIFSGALAKQEAEVVKWQRLLGRQQIG